MPSDLTLQKVTRANTATPAPPVDRETAIMRSHQKANWMQEYPLEGLRLVEDENQAKALAAGFLGAPMDIAQFAADRFAEALVAKKPDLPYTTEDLRQRWGVEDAEWSTLLGAVASPDPFGTGKALILPMGYVRKAGRKADELYEAAVKMFKNNEDPAKIYRATGAFKGKSDEILWHKRDTGQIKPATVREYIDAQIPNLAPGEEGFIQVKPRDILEGDDELFEMFPYLDNVIVRLHVKNRGKADAPEFIFRKDDMADIGVRGEADFRTGEVDLFNAGAEYSSWQESATGTLYHELGHVIDAVTGALPTGGNSATVMKSYGRLNEARLLQELFDQADSGRIIKNYANASPEDQKLLMELFNKHKIPKDAPLDRITAAYKGYIRGLEKGDKSAARVRDFVDSVVDRETATMGTILQEYGQEIPLDQLDENLLYDIASDRYFRLEGEARQRLNQYLIGKRDEEINAFFEQFAKEGKAPKGMRKPVDVADQILEEPVNKADPRQFTGAPNKDNPADFIDFSTEFD